jgi:hypothetical protein
MEKLTIPTTTHNGDLIGVTQGENVGIGCAQFPYELHIVTSGSVTLANPNPSTTLKIN